jgi:hypothetical protein
MEQELTYQQKWIMKNPNYNREYYLKNREKIDNYQKQYKEENKERLKIYSRKYFKEYRLKKKEKKLQERIEKFKASLESC